MPSAHETFWKFPSYAVVGHSAKRPFPRLTYGALKRNEKTVYAIDPSVTRIEDDPSYPSFEALPEHVDAVVMEVPKEETRDWVQRAAAAGIKNVWLHMNTDTPEALATAEQNGLHLCKGTCAVMYLTHGFSPHTIHGFIMKLCNKY